MLYFKFASGLLNPQLFNVREKWCFCNLVFVFLDENCLNTRYINILVYFSSVKLKSMPPSVLRDMIVSCLVTSSPYMESECVFIVYVTGGQVMRLVVH